MDDGTVKVSISRGGSTVRIRIPSLYADWPNWEAVINSATAPGAASG